MTAIENYNYKLSVRSTAVNDDIFTCFCVLGRYFSMNKPLDPSQLRWLTNNQIALSDVSQESHGTFVTVGVKSNVIVDGNFSRNWRTHYSKAHKCDTRFCFNSTTTNSIYKGTYLRFWRVTFKSGHTDSFLFSRDKPAIVSRFFVIIFEI